ncbi:hypothetical protein JCM10212_002838 [Sporobolomyces blumeae]
MPSGRRRFSLSSLSSASSSARSLRRLSSISVSDQPSCRDPVDPYLPAIPFTDPPFMPMFKRPSSPSPSHETVKVHGECNEATPNSPPSTPTARRTRPSSSQPPMPQASSSPGSDPAQGSSSSSRHSSSFFRRLHRRGHGRGELDFGCVGEWNEGPSDLSSSFYDGHGRSESSSSSIDLRTHSRGYSSSSTYSTSTAASSLPPSPKLGNDAFLPHPSRVPLSPRTTQWRRRSDEVAGVEAANEYIARARLSGIAEDAPPVATLVIGDDDSSTTFRPARPSKPRAPAPASQGLAIFGSSKKAHDRSVSADLEIEFIETGHTTFTPLSMDSPSHSSAIVLPEDAFFASSSSSSSSSSSASASEEDLCYDLDTSDDSHATYVPTSTIRRDSLSAGEIGPALDELSTFFTSPTASCAANDDLARFKSPTAMLRIPRSPPLYSRARRPDSFQAAQQARLGRAPVRYDWI